MSSPLGRRILQGLSLAIVACSPVTSVWATPPTEGGQAGIPFGALETHSPREPGTRVRIVAPTSPSREGRSNRPETHNVSGDRQQFPQEPPATQLPVSASGGVRGGGSPVPESDLAR